MIKTSLKNKTATIERHGTTKDDFGDFAGARTQVVAGLNLRIVRNEKFGRGDVDTNGPIVASTHMGITDGNVADAKTGDRLVISANEEYEINFIDPNPGGTIVGDRAHHLEIFMTEHHGVDVP